MLGKVCIFAPTPRGRARVRVRYEWGRFLLNVSEHNMLYIRENTM